MTDPPPAVAQITRLAAPGQPGPVLSRRNSRVALAVDLIPAVALVAVNVAGLGLAVLAAPVVGPRVAFAAAGGGLVSSFLMFVWYSVRYHESLVGWYYHRCSRRAVAARADAVIDPGDPEAVYVEVAPPRGEWDRLLTLAVTDVGFLRADEENGVLLFEGDAERWVIPATAIRAVTVEHYTVGPVARLGGIDVYPVVVVAGTVGGEPWEAAVRPRQTAFRPRSPGDRWREAHRLEHLLRRLAGGATG